MNKYLFLLLFLGCSFNLLAQTHEFAATDNLVPNPSFEKFAAVPIGWFYKGQHFTRVMKYWSAATTASPDVFGPGVRVPTVWAEKGFGNQLARTGKSMIGMTVYGCDNGKPHCREYVQIQMKEPLVIGQEYAVEFWVAHLPRSLQVNNIGVYFADEKLDLKLDALLEYEPQVKANDIVSAYGRNWTKVAGKFIATSEAEYVVAGNFYPDSLTQIRSLRSDSYNYAYYYLDDIKVKKVPPILDVPVKADDLTLITLEEGKIVPLKNIYFETDKSELLPRSYVELNKLLHLMRENPELIIQINGHTDAQGEDEYNQSLSQRRAAAVVTFLNQHGINPTRTLFEGYGSTRPIASNITEEGRQQNRRVEMLIVSK